jgi:hypothetical protein
MIPRKMPVIKRFAVLLMLQICLGGNAFGQAIAPVVIKSGTTLYVITRKAPNVKPELTEARLVDLDDSSPLPDAPPDDEPKTFSQQITAMTEKAILSGGTRTTANLISGEFKQAAADLEKGTITPSNAFSSLRTRLDATLINTGSAWTEWRQSVTAALLDLQQLGVLKTKQQLIDIFNQLSQGINAATGLIPELPTPLLKPAIPNPIQKTKLSYREVQREAKETLKSLTVALEQSR